LRPHRNAILKNEEEIADEADDIDVINIAMIKVIPEWKLKPFVEISAEAMRMEKRSHVGSVFGNAEAWMDIDARRPTKIEQSKTILKNLKKVGGAEGDEEIRKVSTTREALEAAPETEKEIISKVKSKRSKETRRPASETSTTPKFLKAASEKEKYSMSKSKIEEERRKPENEKKLIEI
jgi:hypothetical protein